MEVIDDIFKRLKLIREEKNISLEEISKSTRIRISYLEAIENGDFDKIPSVYDKLFFQSYLEAIKVEKIGDARKPETVLEAVHRGYKLANNI